MKKILALWAVPRSRSTAFTLMMSQRGDYSVLLEPFENAAYRSDEKINNRYESLGPQYNFSNTLNQILSLAENNNIFIKDHAYYIRHIADDDFLSHFNNTFLIRNPEQSLPSFYHKWPDVSINETGYKELSEVFDMVVSKTGRIPPLIDADDLINNPEAIIRAYCELVGIPFVTSALKWEKPTHKLSVWHDHLATTQGFEERADRPYQNIFDNNKLKELHEECLPYYTKLYEHRIKISEP